MDKKLANRKVEEMILGQVLRDPEALNRIDLEPDDFFDSRCRKTFEGMLDLFLRGHKIDAVLLSDWLAVHGGVPEPEKYLAGIGKSKDISESLESYAGLVRDKARRRRLLKAGEKIRQSVYSDGKDGNELVLDAQNAVIEACGEEVGETVEIGEMVFDAVRRIKESAGKKDELTGLSSGFRDIDKKTRGFQDSDLIILAARPSMGKTALALNIASHAGIREGKSVLIFSLEMSREQITSRLISAGALVDMEAVREGNVDEYAWQALDAFAARLASSRIAVNDTPGLNVARIRAACSRRKAREGLDLIVIDYMQLLSGERTRTGDNRQNEISEISRGLKQLAREMECPVLCLSQLARAPELRLDHHPKLSDLRDSGAIEQDADVVMFLYRKAYYEETDFDEERTADLDIAKQRNGPTGMIKLGWKPEYTLFTDMDYGEEEY